MGALVIVVVLLVGIGVAVLAYQARQRRIAELTRLAMQLSLGYHPDDDDHIVDLPFALFSRGDGRKVSDVLVGTRDGSPVQIFAFEYYDEHRSTNAQGVGITNRSYTHFTCGLLTLPMAVPHLTLGPESILTRLGAHLGLRDIELESNEFNAAYRVRCGDERFAFSLLDARMMEWLVGFGGSIKDLEACGPWVLVAVDRLAPAEWPTLLDFFREPRARIPSVVYSTYPPR